MAMRSNNEFLMEALMDLKACLIQNKHFHCSAKNMYDFINMRGHKRIHECKAVKKFCAISKLERFAINYLGVIIPDVEVEKSNTIPRNMMNTSRESVDENMIKNAFKDCYAAWMKLQMENKKLYEDIWYKAVENHETALASYVKCMLEKEECKIKELNRCYMDMKAINWDVAMIMLKEESIHDFIRDHKMKDAAII